MVPQYMFNLRSREGEQSVSDGTNYVPVGLESGVGVFDDGFASGSNASDKALVVGGQANARGDRLVAEFEEVKKEAHKREHAVAFRTEGADMVAVGVPSTRSKARTTWETAEGPAKCATVE